VEDWRCIRGAGALTLGWGELNDAAAAYLVQYALMQPLSGCADSSDAYALQRSSKYKCFLGLLVHMALLQVMADSMSCAAALAWSNDALKSCIDASVLNLVLQL
jgi:hypothetical protein